MSDQDDRRFQAGNLERVDDSTALDPSSLTDLLGPESVVDEAPLAGTMLAGESAAAPDHDAREWQIEVGSDVIGQCGHKVGEVVAVRDDVIVVEKGFFMPVDFYIPKSAIQRNNEHGLYLNVSKNDALHRGWDVDPRMPRAS